jgi:hypothetical protein
MFISLLNLKVSGLVKQNHATAVYNGAVLNAFPQHGSTTAAEHSCSCNDF